MRTSYVEAPQGNARKEPRTISATRGDAVSQSEMDESEGKVAVKLFLSFLLAILTIILLAAFFKVVSFCWEWMENNWEGKNARRRQLDSEHVKR